MTEKTKKIISIVASCVVLIVVLVIGYFSATAVVNLTPTTPPIKEEKIQPTPVDTKTTEIDMTQTNTDNLTVEEKEEIAKLPTTEADQSPMLKESELPQSVSDLGSGAKKLYSILAVWDNRLDAKDISVSADGTLVTIGNWVYNTTQDKFYLIVRPTAKEIECMNHCYPYGRFVPSRNSAYEMEWLKPSDVCQMTDAKVKSCPTP